MIQGNEGRGGPFSLGHRGGTDRLAPLPRLLTDNADPPSDDAETPDPPEEGGSGSELVPSSHPPTKRFRAATDEELDPQSFMVASDRSALRAVLRGGSIEQDRGDAEFIGRALRRLAHTLRQAAEVYRAGTGFISNPLLRNLQFGHSVTIELEISAEEDVQMGIEGRRHSPTIDATHAVARLLASDPEELLPQAIKLGSDVTVAYKQFLNLLAGDNVTLEWMPADATEIVVVSSVDARHDFAILDTEGERRTEAVAVPGTLTMADSELHQFALTLPSEMARPPLLKGKHRVRGTFPEDMGHRLKDEGLWDSQVMATIDVTYDVPGSTATPRPPAYVLVDAEPLVPNTPSLFDPPEDAQEGEGYFIGRASESESPPAEWFEESTEVDPELKGRWKWIDAPEEDDGE